MSLEFYTLHVRMVVYSIKMELNQKQRTLLANFCNDTAKACLASIIVNKAVNPTSTLINQLLITCSALTTCLLFLYFALRLEGKANYG